MIEGKEPIHREVPFQQKRDLAAGSAPSEEGIKGIEGSRRAAQRRTGAASSFTSRISPAFRSEPDLSVFVVANDPQLISLGWSRAPRSSRSRDDAEFVKHRMGDPWRTVHTHRSQRRGHVLEGQPIAISSLDEVIRFARFTEPKRGQSPTPGDGISGDSSARGGDAAFTADSQAGTAEVYRMTEQQAEAVVRLQLGGCAPNATRFTRNTPASANKSSTTNVARRRKNILDVVEPTCTMRDKYGDDRRTEISDSQADGRSGGFDHEEDQVVSLSHNGYIKRLPSTPTGFSIAAQGVSAVPARTFPSISSSSTQLICSVRTWTGLLAEGFNIPEASRTSGGRPIANVLSLKPEEKIASVIRCAIRKFSLATERPGQEDALIDYSRPREWNLAQPGRRGDETPSTPAKPNDEILLSAAGMAIVFQRCPADGPQHQGVKGVNLQQGDYLIGMVVADGGYFTVRERLRQAPVRSQHRR